MRTDEIGTENNVELFVFRQFAKPFRLRYSKLRERSIFLA